MAILFCTTSAELVTALVDCMPTDTVLLDHTVLFEGEFFLGYKGVIAPGDEIIIEGDGDPADLPPDGWRVFPEHSPYLAKLQTPQSAPFTNARVLSTVAGLAVNGYILRKLEFLPSYKGGSSQIQLGRNDATQTTYSQVAYNITFDQCIVRGHPISGQRSGIANHAAGTIFKNGYIYDHKTLGGEAVGIGGGNFTGSMKILNTTIVCAGIPYITGGGDNRIQTTATVAASPAPTTTTATLSTVADLSVGQRLSILCGANSYRRWPLVTAIDGNDVTFEEISIEPDVPGNVVWGANPVDIEIYRCHLTRDVTWRDGVLAPTPVITDVTVIPAAVGLAPGDYFAVVQALHDDIGYQSNTYWSDVSAEVPFTVTETSEIDFTWTAPTTPIPTTKTRVYRYQKDGGGNRINARFYLVTGQPFTFTDVNDAGTSYTTYPAETHWTGKNLGEFKIGSNWHIHECISEFAWDMGGGSHGFWGKNSNQQDGPGHAFCEVDNVLIEWCLWRSMIGGLSLSTQRSTSNHPRDWGKKPSNWVVRNCLFYDSNASWANPPRPTSVAGLGLSGAGDDFVFDHITQIHLDGTGFIGLGWGAASVPEPGYWTNLEVKNSLWIRGTFGLKGTSLTEGHVSFNAATNDTGNFDRNVIAGATAGLYNFAGKTNYFPDQTTFENQFKDYGDGTNGDYRLKRLSEGDDIDSLYINAATDGLDIGCDVKTLMEKLDGVIEGHPAGAGQGEGDPVVSVRSSRLFTSEGTDTVAIDAPVGTVTGDVVIVIIHMNETATTATDDNGATPFDLDVADEDQTTHAVSVFSRRIEAGDPSTYNFSLSASTRVSAIAITLQDVHPTIIYDVIPVIVKALTTSVNASDITTTTNDALHVVAGLADILIDAWPSFNGTTSRIATGVDTLTPFTKSTPFTIEARVKTDNASTFMALVSSQMTGSTGKGIQLGFNNNGAVLLRIQGALRLERATNSSLATNAWEHIAATYNGLAVGSGIEFIHNGAVVASTISNENDPGDMTTTSETYLGARNATEIPYDGEMRDVRIWKGMRVHPVQANALKDTLDLSLIKTATLFDGHASKFAAIANQGVATDGTHIYCTNNTTVKKYTLAGAEVATRDHGLAGFKYEDPTVTGGVLYIPLSNHPTTPRVGKVQKLNTSDLSIISTTDLSEAIWPASVVHRGTSLWISVTESATLYIYNTSLALQFTRTFPVQGAQNVTWPGYSGLMIIGNYLYGNKHEGDIRGLDIAEFVGGGSSLQAVGAFRHVSSGTTQGLCHDTVNNKVYWAGRGHSNQVWESNLTGGLVAQWKMNEGSGTSIADSGKTPADTGTASNITWVGAADGAIDTTPAGYSVQQNGGDMPVAVATKTIDSAGATGAQAFTSADANPGMMSVSFAIRSGAIQSGLSIPIARFYYVFNLD